MTTTTMMMMIRVSASLIALLLCFSVALLLPGSLALSSSTSTAPSSTAPSSRPHQTFPRRAFLESSTRVIIAPFFLMVASSPFTANAYERRNVGGEGRSPETAAMNEQAYQTSNRLEQQGFKLETQEEQKASLTAALSDYSYDSSIRSSSSSSSGSGSKKSSEKQRASKK